MRVDVLNVGGAHRRLAQRLLHGATCAAAVLRTGRQVIRVSAGAIADQLRQGFGPTPEGVLQ